LVVKFLIVIYCSFILSLEFESLLVNEIVINIVNEMLNAIKKIYS